MGQLYIVARDRPELYERLRGNLVNEPDARRQPPIARLGGRADEVRGRNHCARDENMRP
jgi:hypothetical protein